LILEVKILLFLVVILASNWKLEAAVKYKGALD